MNTKDIENHLELLIKYGLVEVSAIDEDGKFCYSLTDKGYRFHALSEDDRLDIIESLLTLEEA